MILSNKLKDRIPTSFKLFATTFNVEFDNERIFF